MIFICNDIERMFLAKLLGTEKLADKFPLHNMFFVGLIVEFPGWGNIILN